MIYERTEAFCFDILLLFYSAYFEKKNNASLGSDDLKVVFSELSAQVTKQVIHALPYVGTQSLCTERMNKNRIQAFFRCIVGS